MNANAGDAAGSRLRMFVCPSPWVGTHGKDANNGLAAQRRHRHESKRYDRNDAAARLGFTGDGSVDLRPRLDDAAATLLKTVAATGKTKP